MNQRCQGCQRGLPIHNGIHLGEVEMFRCERFKILDHGTEAFDSWPQWKRDFELTKDSWRLKLEPEYRDTWHQREKRDVPFVGGVL